MTIRSALGLLARAHRDEEGSVSLETILVIGAVALPILIFLMKVGWPKIRDQFMSRLDELEEGAREAKQ
jgi:F0F1-type ATP synthase membrane subunit b/b'